MPCLRARVAPLHERVRSDASDDGEGDEARADDREQTPALAPGADPLALQLVLGLPREDRWPEDVVKDLVARRRAEHAVDAADDALAPEPLEQAPQFGVVDRGVFRKVRRLVGDLSPGGCDELAHNPRSRLLLSERQGIERSADVLTDDGTRAADRAERREPQLARARLSLALPQPLEHELEVRRLDAALGRSLVEHRFDESLLRREPLSGQLAVTGERATSCGKKTGVFIER